MSYRHEAVKRSVAKNQKDSDRILMDLYPEAMQKYLEITVVPRQPCHCNVLICACICRSLLDGR